MTRLRAFGLPRRQTLLAFLIAPASFGILLLLLATDGTGVWAFKLACFFAYPISFIIGIPSFIGFKLLRINGYVSYALMSLVLALVPITYFIVVPQYDQQGNFTFLLHGTIHGQMIIVAFASFLTVTVFWLIARPDKADANGSPE